MLYLLVIWLPTVSIDTANVNSVSMVSIGQFDKLQDCQLAASVIEQPAKCVSIKLKELSQ